MFSGVIAWPCGENKKRAWLSQKRASHCPKVLALAGRARPGRLRPCAGGKAGTPRSPGHSGDPQRPADPARAPAGPHLPANELYQPVSPRARDQPDGVLTQLRMSFCQRVTDGNVSHELLRLQSRSVWLRSVVPVTRNVADVSSSSLSRRIVRHRYSRGHRMTEMFRGFGRGSTLEFSGAL